MNCGGLDRKCIPKLRATPDGKPGPAGAAAAKQRRVERGRGRGAADADLVQAQHLDARLGGHHAVGDGVDGVHLAHCWHLIAPRSGG